MERELCGCRVQYTLHAWRGERLMYKNDSPTQTQACPPQIPQILALVWFLVVSPGPVTPTLELISARTMLGLVIASTLCLPSFVRSNSKTTQAISKGLEGTKSTVRATRASNRVISWRWYVFQCDWGTERIMQERGSHGRCLVEPLRTLLPTTGYPRRTLLL